MENQDAKRDKPVVPRPDPMPTPLERRGSGDSAGDNAILAMMLGAIALAAIVGLALRMAQ